MFSSGKMGQKFHSMFVVVVFFGVPTSSSFYENYGLCSMLYAAGWLAAEKAYNVVS